MRIIFMGTPDFAVPSLQRLAAEGYKPVAVVTGPDKPRGRGQVVRPTPVKKAAIELGVDTILQPTSVKEPSFAEDIRALEADLIVVVAFRILPPAVFGAAKLGSINLHGSLLPKYRGAAPINRAVMAGESETGVTTFFLREAVDTGNLILQRGMEIGPDETAGEVHDRMMELGAQVVVETVRLIEAGKAEAVPQEDVLATPAPKVFREDAQIPWDLPAPEVHNLIRGLSPFPGAWTYLDDALVKVYRTRLAEGVGEPGEVIMAGERLVAACGTGAIEIVELQLEGKRRMTAEDFLHGHDLRVGQLFNQE